MWGVGSPAWFSSQGVWESPGALRLLGCAMLLSRGLLDGENKLPSLLCAQPHTDGGLGLVLVGIQQCSVALCCHEGLG